MSNKYKRLISVDLGLTGFISVVDINEKEFKVIDSFKIEVEEKDIHVLKQSKSKSKAVIKNQASFSLNLPLIEKYKTENTLGLFEYITSRPINSQLSMMSLQDSACCFRCLFESLNLDYSIIQPKAWKLGLNIGTEKKHAKELFDILINTNKIIINEDIKSLTKKVKNHNQIESVLIAYYYFKFKNK